MNYLLLGLGLGLFLGTLPGVRELTPWGKPPVVEKERSGAWMYQRAPGSLDQPGKPAR